MFARDVDFEAIYGLTFSFVKRGKKEDSDYILFHEKGGRSFIQYHKQDCCEGVDIEDICGDLKDLVGVPILLAEESTNKDPSLDESKDESGTWTFYKLATIKGFVTIRWYGTSNGYYSETANFSEILQGANDMELHGLLTNEDQSLLTELKNN